MSGKNFGYSKWASSVNMQSLERKPVGISSSSLQRRSEPKLPDKTSFTSLNRQNEVYHPSNSSKPAHTGGGYLQDIGTIVHNQHMSKFKERYNTQSAVAGPQFTGIPVYIDRNIKTQQSSNRISRDRLGSSGSLHMHQNPRENPAPVSKALQVELSSKIVAASKPAMQLLTNVIKSDATVQAPGVGGQHFSWLWKERHPQATNVLQTKALKSVDNIITDYYLNHPEQAGGAGTSKAKLDALVKNVQPEGHTILAKQTPSIPVKARKGEVEDFPTREYASKPAREAKDSDVYPKHED